MSPTVMIALAVFAVINAGFQIAAAYAMTKLRRQMEKLERSEAGTVERHPAGKYPVELINGRRIFRASNGELVDLDKLSDSLR